MHQVSENKYIHTTAHTYARKLPKPGARMLYMSYRRADHPLEWLSKREHPFPPGPPPRYSEHYEDCPILMQEPRTWADVRVTNLVFNHYAKQNALDVTALNALIKGLRKADENSHHFICILRSSNPHYYCGGTDLLELYQQGKKGNLSYGRKFYRKLYELEFVIRKMKTPLFCESYGLNVGGGIAFTSADFYMGFKTSSFCYPNVLHGAVPELAATKRFYEVPGHLGIYYLLTGKRINSTDLMYLGIGKEHMNRSQFRFFEQDFHNAQTGYLTDIYERLDEYREPVVNKFSQHEVVDQIESVFSQDTLPAVFRKLKSIDTPWSRCTLNRLKQASPLMLMVSWRMLDMARENSYDYIRCVDYNQCLNQLKCHDFYEGIRARCIDYSQPKWMHYDISEVRKADVDSLFKRSKHYKPLDFAEPSKLWGKHEENDHDANQFYIDMATNDESPFTRSENQDDLSTISGMEKVIRQRMSESGLHYWMAHYQAQEEQEIVDAWGSAFSIERVKSILEQTNEWMYHQQNPLKNWRTVIKN